MKWVNERMITLSVLSVELSVKKALVDLLI